MKSVDHALHNWDLRTDTSSVHIEFSGKAHVIRDVCLGYLRSIRYTRDVFKLYSEKQVEF